MDLKKILKYQIS